MASTSANSHRALRILLLILSVVAGLGGLLVLFGTGFIASKAPTIWFAAPGFADLFLKFAGIVAITMAYLAYTASRDPVRYVAFIDAFAFLLIAAAVLDVYGLVVIHTSPFYPAGYVVGRSIVRLALAFVLVALRPRGTAS